MTVQQTIPGVNTDVPLINPHDHLANYTKKFYNEKFFTVVYN